MFSKLPMYQRVGASAYRPGLERMIDLDAYLNYPHKQFHSIHIGGTNGKGSTSHALASVLQTAGYKVGLYTSPHLLDFRERIKINGEKISEKEVIQFVLNHQTFFESHQVSFFEMTVGMAFSHFKSHQVDFAIVEVGLGGRLDATNIINPLISVITNIGLDHTEFLGTTRAQIAVEKAGIIKSHVPVVIGEKDLETQHVFEKIASKNNAPLFFAEPLEAEWNTDLKGNYQKKNIQTVVAVLKQLKNVNVVHKTIQKGFQNVIRNTGLQGRWQLVSENPKIILDVGHNKEGLSLVAEQVKRMEYTRLHFILGFVKGKNVKELISLFPQDAFFYLSSPKIDRAIPVSELEKQLKNLSRQIHYYTTLKEALQQAQTRATAHDLIVVCGSTFVVAEVLSLF
jgi:dihydrofolate synthase/folylpolyglutamate synthase